MGKWGPFRIDRSVEFWGFVLMTILIVWGLILGFVDPTSRQQLNLIDRVLGFLRKIIRFVEIGTFFGG